MLSIHQLSNIASGSAPLVASEVLVHVNTVHRWRSDPDAVCKSNEYLRMLTYTARSMDLIGAQPFLANTPHHLLQAAGFILLDYCSILPKMRDFLMLNSRLPMESDCEREILYMKTLT